MTNLLWYVVWGAVGGVLSQLFGYWASSRTNQAFHFLRSGLVVILSASVTAAWFMLVDRTEVKFYTAIQYGLFLGLLFDEMRLQWDKRKYGDPETGLTSPHAGASNLSYMLATTSAVKEAHGLIISGFWSVFGVGLLGGAITATAMIKGGRKALHGMTTSDWLYWAIAVVLGALVSVLNGISDVNALTVLQLGSTFPLLKQKL